jgi:type I restriction enzyme S subunit
MGWRRFALKRVVTTPITDGPHITPELQPRGIPFVSAEAVWDGRIHLDAMRGFISVEDNAEFSRKYSPEAEDIYIVKSGATTGKVAINTIVEPFNIWSPLAAIRCNQDTAMPRFVFYALTSAYFQEAVQVSWNVGTQPNIGMEVIENLSILLPPVEDQCRIADYLDAQTSEMDALIAQKERMLALLEEKRAAVVTHAVTRGVDPHVKLKPTEMECFGDIPNHWRLMKLKHFAHVSYGVGDELDKSLASGVPLISLPNVSKDGSLDLSEHGWAELDDDQKERMLLRKGDLLFNWRNGSSEHLGKTAYFDSDNEFTHVGFLLRVRFDLDSHCPRYFQNVLNTLRATGYFLYSRAMVNNTFNQTELENLPLIVPPFEEQSEIAAHLNRTLTLTDAIRSELRNSVVLLRERRSALITAAVTGQIPIEELAA